MSFSSLISPCYFNPRTSCEVRLVSSAFLQFPDCISIHAPRVRCDRPCRFRVFPLFSISIHAPRVRCDKNRPCGPENAQDFNPRTSCEVRLRVKCGLRNAAIISIHAPRVRCDYLHTSYSSSLFNFNPRTSCEVRRIISRYQNSRLFISIHAPRVRCDVSYLICVVFYKKFQSTHLV